MESVQYLIVRQFKAMCTFDMVVETVQEQVTPSTITDESDVFVVVVDVIVIRHFFSVVVFASSAALLLFVRVCWFSLQSKVHRC